MSVLRQMCLHLILGFVYMLGKLIVSENLPCIARETDLGYVCVCNETYCDTIERPIPLSRGLFYHYSTAQDNPGFTVSTGEVINTTAALGDTMGVILRVNPSIRYQYFEGMGAALSDSSSIVINSLPPSAKQKFIESYFGDSGLEFSFIRVPIAASDFSPHYYSYDDTPGDVELKNFNLTEYDFNLKIPIIHLAKKASKRSLKLMGVAWTAPPWMKTNNGPKGGYIRTKYFGAWANYHLKFLEAYKSFGLDFWGISQGNELALFLFMGKLLTIPNIMMAPQQAHIYTKKYLGPLLKSSGHENVKIFSLDDNRPFLLWYFDRLCADKEVDQFIDGAALHWYFDSDDNVYLLDEFHKKYPDKLILYTETSINPFMGGDYGVKLGSWRTAVTYFTNIYQNLAHWVNGYIDWNIALNENGGPSGSTGIPLDASTIVNTTNGEFYKQPVYYVFGHFSKFIIPGAKIVDITLEKDTYRPGNDGYYFDFEKNISLSRRMKEPHVFKRDLIAREPLASVSSLAASNPDGSRTVIIYNPEPKPVTVVIIDTEVGILNRTVEANSVNTFVYW